MKNNKLVIDITQLLHWQGKLTGIPRVMNELALRYQGKESVDFVAWEPSLKTYLKLDIDKSLKDRGAKIHYDGVNQKNSSVSLFTFKAARKLKNTGIPIPGRVISTLGTVVHSTSEYDFSKGDHLFILWGEINDANFISSVEALKERGIGIIQVSYDMLPLVTPQYSGHSTKGMTVYNTAIFPIADLILAISEHTKTDIIKWLSDRRLTVPRVEVFRLGDDFKLSKPIKPSDKLFKESKLKGNDYLLTVGTIEARKNHTLLYYVYKLAESKQIDLPKIVIVGRKGWLGESVYEFMKNDPVVKDKFVVLESTSDEELSWLYKHAILSVYPSFYEGWGLPIAESIAHGTPCVCSDTSSMPEVAGDLVGYFSPLSAEECLQKIQQMIKPDRIKEQKSTIKKYTPTSWDTAFRQVDSFIKEIQ